MRLGIGYSEWIGRWKRERPWLAYRRILARATRPVLATPRTALGTYPCSRWLTTARRARQRRPQTTAGDVCNCETFPSASSSSKLQQWQFCSCSLWRPLSGQLPTSACPSATPYHRSQTRRTFVKERRLYEPVVVAASFAMLVGWLLALLAAIDTATLSLRLVVLTTCPIHCRNPRRSL